MSRFVSLLKMNMRILLRNKAFLFFLCLTPIIAVIILSLKTESTLYEEKEERTSVIELEDCTKKAVYKGDTYAFIIKVYDASHTELSEYVLKSLASSGMFSVCRCDVSDMSEEEVHEQIKKDAFDDRAGVLVYLKENFDACVMEAQYDGAIQIFDVSDDDRIELFETELTDLLVQLHQLAGSNGIEQHQIPEILNQINDAIPQKQVVNFNGKEEVALTKQQSAHKDHIGYALAILTLGCLFCGVFVAHTVIEEQNNKVYTRMMLSQLTQMEYMLSKLVISVIITIMQTLILAVCIFVVKDIDFGINKLSFLVIIFLIGLIFSVLSFVIGVLVGDVMSSNYAVYIVWTISALLSGLYFPLGDTSKALKALSYLMPQRWFMRASEMLFVEDKGAYPMVLYVTVAYLVIIMSIGIVGLKVRSKE